MRLPLFCALALLSFVAVAQSPTSNPSSKPGLTPSEEKRAQAKELFLRAEASYKAGEFRKASETYQEAFALYQEPALLYNAGQCEYRLGKYEAALGFYRRYLQMVPNSPLRPDLERLFLMVEGVRQEEPKEVTPKEEPPKEAPKEEPTSTPVEEPPKETEPSIPQRSALISTESKGKSFSVQVRSKEEVFSCSDEVSAASPCLLRDLPEGELTIEMKVGKRATYKESFQMQEGGVAISVGHRGSIRRFVLVTSALFVAGSLRATIENKDNTWALGVPFLGGAYWSMRRKNRLWNKVTVTPAVPQESKPPQKEEEALSLGEVQVAP